MIATCHRHRRRQDLKFDWLVSSRSCKARVLHHNRMQSGWRVVTCKQFQTHLKSGILDVDMFREFLGAMTLL